MFDFKLSSFFLVQITQDAVLYSCRFTGTAHVPGISQGLSLRPLKCWSNCTVQQCQHSPRSWAQGSEAATAQLLGLLSPPQQLLPSQTATKTPFLQPPAGTNPSAGWLWEDAVALLPMATLLWDEHRLPAAAPAEGQPRFLPKFQLILHPRAHGWQGSSLFPAPPGECGWVQVCAASLVRQSKAGSSSAPRQSCSGQRKPPCERGWHCTLALPSTLSWESS